MATIEERTRKALDVIKNTFGKDEGEDNVTLFVEHHLEELPSSYWKQHLGSDFPGPAAILGLLVFRSSWGEGGIEQFDFTLPDNVTDYVISVHFDETGVIDDISMES